MNIKKTVTILIILAAIFSTLSIASAGLFDFGPSDDRIETNIIVLDSYDTVEDSYTIAVELTTDENGELEFLPNEPLEINVTDTYGGKQTYNMTTDQYGVVLITDVPTGIYTVSVKFNGDDKYRDCNASQRLELTDFS